MTGLIVLFKRWHCLVLLLL